MLGCGAPSPRRRRCARGEQARRPGRARTRAGDHSRDAMDNGPTSITDLLRTLHEQGGSDLHLKVGRPPMMRLRGDLAPLAESPVLTAEDVERLMSGVISADQRARLHTDKELDFSFAVAGIARFRGNGFFQRGVPGVVFRL